MVKTNILLISPRGPPHTRIHSRITNRIVIIVEYYSLPIPYNQYYTPHQVAVVRLKFDMCQNQISTMCTIPKPDIG